MRRYVFVCIILYVWAVSLSGVCVLYNLCVCVCVCLELWKDVCMYMCILCVLFVLFVSFD